MKSVNYTYARMKRRPPPIFPPPPPLSKRSLSAINSDSNEIIEYKCACICVIIFREKRRRKRHVQLLNIIRGFLINSSHG